jgi:hypothetical protein
MGDYSELQKENLAKFWETKSAYIEFIASFTIYTLRYLDLGRKLSMLYNLEAEAQVCFEDILKYSPNNAEAHYALGRTSGCRAW